MMRTYVLTSIYIIYRYHSWVTKEWKLLLLWRKKTSGKNIFSSPVCKCCYWLKNTPAILLSRSSENLKAPTLSYVELDQTKFCFLFSKLRNGWNEPSPILRISLYGKEHANFGGNLFIQEARSDDECVRNVFLFFLFSSKGGRGKLGHVVVTEREPGRPFLNFVIHTSIW